MNPLTFIISITLVVISITPSLARSLPTNSTWEEVWRDAVRKGGILYDQMQSGCFPDKQNPIKFSELLAQGWTVNDKSGPEIQFPPDLTSPFLAGSVKRVLPWTQGDDYYGTSLKHIISAFFNFRNWNFFLLTCLRTVTNASANRNESHHLHPYPNQDTTTNTRPKKASSTPKS